MKSLRRLAVALFLLASASLMHAGNTRTVNASCEKAIAKATFLAAQRKRAAIRPYPNAPALNIESNRNFAKQVLLPLGEVWSHKKNGELAFDGTEDTCAVTSNGHPADVILTDLVKALGHPTVAGLSAPAGLNTAAAKSKGGDCGGYDTSSSIDCHGMPRR